MAGQLTIDTLSASSGVLATQNGMTGIAKAWVNFDGSTAAIRGSFNVGSVTKNGTGDYTVNFTTAMPNANYAGTALNSFTASVYLIYFVSATTSGIRVNSYNGLVSPAADANYVQIAVFSS